MWEVGGGRCGSHTPEAAFPGEEGFDGVCEGGKPGIVAKEKSLFFWHKSRKSFFPNGKNPGPAGSIYKPVLPLHLFVYATAYTNPLSIKTFISAVIEYAWC